MRGRAQALIDRWLAVPRTERLLVLGAMAAAIAAVLLYVLATRSHVLQGDERFYDEMARFWADGKLWWSTTPFGDAHPSAWKPPLYPAFVGTLYAIFGESPLRAEIVQSLLAAIAVFLTWALGRRLFGPTVAVVAAWIVALFPLTFEYYGLLFSEALAIPLMVATFLLFLGRQPTTRLAIAVGALVGVGLLVRPTSGFVLAGVLAAFVVAAGWRRGAALTGLAIVVAAIVVSPWTIRNYTEHDGLIPISVQDGAAYGTFNPESAADSENPWAWRAVLRDLPEVLADPEPGQTEADLRSGAQSFAWDYIEENPSSVPKAFFWNGVVRFWDLRRPSTALEEVDFQGRSRAARGLGLGMYWILLPLAAFGLWRLRGRRELLIPLLAVVAAASVTFTIIGGTRYRAPLEPVIVLAAASLLPPRARVLDPAEAEDRADRGSSGPAPAG